MKGRSIDYRIVGADLDTGKDVVKVVRASSVMEAIARARCMNIALSEDPVPVDPEPPAPARLDADPNPYPPALYPDAQPPRPAPGHYPAPQPVFGHVTIEKTSKAIKGQMVACVTVMLCSLAACAVVASGAKEIAASHDQTDLEFMRILVGLFTLVFWGSLVWWVVIRFKQWWHHG